jgi:hypothetical protein
LIAAAGLAGCTTVSITNAEVIERRYPGLTVLQVVPGASGVSVIDTRGLGLVMGVHSATLGALRETTFLATDASRCRTIIVIQNEQQLQSLKESLATRPLIADLCVVKSRNEPQPPLGGPP